MEKLIRQFVSFLSVGAIATLCHYVVLIILVEASLLTPVPAAAIGAFVGAVISYRLNRQHTFQSDRSHKQAVPRFFLIAGLAVVLNTILMAFFTGPLALPYLFAQVIATGLIIILTFGGNKFWTFRQ